MTTCCPTKPQLHCVSEKNVLLSRLPGTVAPGRHMFHCSCFFLIYLFCHDISKLPRPTALKLHMIGSWLRFMIQIQKIGASSPPQNGTETCKIRHDFGQLQTSITNISRMDGDIHNRRYMRSTTKFPGIAYVYNADPDHRPFPSTPSWTKSNFHGEFQPNPLVTFCAILLTTQQRDGQANAGYHVTSCHVTSWAHAVSQSSAVCAGFVNFYGHGEVVASFAENPHAVVCDWQQLH